MLTRGSRPYPFYELGCGSFGGVGVVGSMKAVEHEHGSYHVLDTVVTVGEIVHWFVLFIDYPDAGFVSANDNKFDVFCGLALLLERSVDLLSGFDGGLGVEFGWWYCHQRRWCRGQRDAYPDMRP